MSKTARTTVDDIKTRREEEILETASKYFSECGYSEADTQTLADRLGVGKGTIYRYFPSKRELFLAAVDRSMQQLHEIVTDAIVGIEDPFDKIIKAIQAYLNFFLDRPEVVELLIQERAHFKDRLKPTYFEHQERYVTRWQEMFVNLITEGRVRNLPVERITDFFSDLLYGTMFTNYFVGQDKVITEQVKEIVDITLYGILSDAERKRRKSQDDSQTIGIQGTG